MDATHALMTERLAPVHALIHGVLVPNEDGFLAIPLPEQRVLHPGYSEYALTFLPPSADALPERIQFFNWLCDHIDQEVTVYFLPQDSPIPHHTLLVMFPHDEIGEASRSLEIYN